jgi:hypothetical protein
MQKQALDLLVQQLLGIVEAQEKQQYRFQGHDSDFSLMEIAQAVLGPQPIEDREAWRPLYDAAWELCRIGVLRPGEIAPRGMNSVSRLGDYYSITEFGREWLKEAANRPFLDQSHLNEILQSYGARFGDGYRQRAVEAVRSYQTCKYLAVCVMSGAAAESILLALAITKRGGNEEAVLAEYRSRQGRRMVTIGEHQVRGSLCCGISIQVMSARGQTRSWGDVHLHDRSPPESGSRFVI